MPQLLPDLPELNEVAPKNPNLNGRDGLQIAHIQGTDYWTRNFSELLGAIDPDGLLNPNGITVTGLRTGLR